MRDRTSEPSSFRGLSRGRPHAPTWLFKPPTSGSHVLRNIPKILKENTMKSALKGDEAALIAAAVAGKWFEDIAHIADVSVSTVQRRLRDPPEIAAAIREGRADHQRQAVGRLNEDLNYAIERLRDLIDHRDPSIALRAIDKLIAHAHHFNQALDTATQDQTNNDQAGAVIESRGNGTVGARRHAGRPSACDPPDQCHGARQSEAL